MDSNPKITPMLLQRLLLLVGLSVGLAVFLTLLPGDTRDALWIGLIAQRSLVGMLFFFVLIVLSLVWSTGQRVDSYIFTLLNRQHDHSHRLDGLMWLTTQLGSMWAALLSAPVFFVIHSPRLAVEVVIGTMTLWLLVEAIKMLTDRSRPFLVLEGTRIIGRKESGRSFPSGHTSQIFFMATLLRYLLKLDMGQMIALYSIAMLVGFTRIYVGAHYPRDVLAGAVLGSVWGLIVALIDPYFIIFGV
jgi:membrane-associated phospholipid phosphatase